MTSDKSHILHLGWTSPSNLWCHIGTFHQPKGHNQPMTFRYTHGMTEATRLTG